MAVTEWCTCNVPPSPQRIDTSSWWRQLWPAQPPWVQLTSDVSLPVHRRLSSQIGPVPLPCTWPRYTPNLLHIVTVIIVVIISLACGGVHGLETEPYQKVPWFNQGFSVLVQQWLTMVNHIVNHGWPWLNHSSIMVYLVEKFPLGSRGRAWWKA